MTAQNALTPIAGTNGYQQQIAIDPNEPLSLSVANASGRITIAASDQPNVWVVVRRTDDHHDEDDGVGITVSVEGNAISIRPEWPIASGLQGLAKRVRDQLQHGFNPDDWNLSKLHFHPDLEYDIRVEIPRGLKDGSRVQAKSASGRIDISGARADVTAASASGSVRLTDIAGKTTSHTASGSVRASDVSGSLEVNTASGSLHVTGGEAWIALRTASGSIKLDDYTLKNARIVTVSGSVSGTIRTPNASDYSFETVSGSVKLDASVPATGSSAQLSFKTLSGSARVDGDWVVDGKRSWRIGLDEDGPRFRVKTVSGSLKITGHADPELTARREPMPVSRPAVDDQDMETEPFTPQDASDDHDRQGKEVSANLDLDLNLDKALSWAKDTARRFTPPTPPTPPTPATPATAVSPATPPTTSDWSWSTGAGTPPPGRATHAAETASGDTTPIPAPQAPIPASGDASNSVDAETEADAAQAERDAAQAEADAIQAEEDAAQAERDAVQAEEDAAQAKRDAAQEAAETGREAVATGDTGSLQSVDAERLHILEALERGEIDVDEALATIEREESRPT